MGFIGKLKLLFAERKPIQDVITELKGIKTGFKTWQFWMTLLPSVSAIIVGATSVLPTSVVLISTTVITLVVSLYNVWRGAVKSQVPGQRPFFKSSEVWSTSAGVISAAIVTLQSGGINPKIFTTIVAAIGIMATSLGAGQNLAGQQPTPEIQKPPTGNP